MEIRDFGCEEVATVVCEATERTEILRFSFYGLSDLCGEENFYTQVAPLPMWIAELKTDSRCYVSILS